MINLSRQLVNNSAVTPTTNNEQPTTKINNPTNDNKVSLRKSMHPKEISISSFTYELPEERIALFPLEKRDASKLLIYKNGAIAEDTYRNLADHLPEKSLLVFNDTRVLPARLLFKKESGGTIEIFCLAPHEKYKGIAAGIEAKGSVDWLCMVGGASKWKKGQLLEKKIMATAGEIILHAEFIEKRTDSFGLRLSWFPDHFSFCEILH